MSELKPCPFCGGEAVLKILSTDGIAMMPKIMWHKVMCKKCEAIIACTYAEEAIEKWNRRVNDETE